MMDLRKKCNLKPVETPASFAPNGTAANTNPPIENLLCWIDQASEAILALKPVTFRYKEELDPTGVPQFGLAEQVEKVDPSRCASTQKEACLVRCSAMP